MIDYAPSSRVTRVLSGDVSQSSAAKWPRPRQAEGLGLFVVNGAACSGARVPGVGLGEARGRLHATPVPAIEVKFTDRQSAHGHPKQQSKPRKPSLYYLYSPVVAILGAAE